MRRATRSCVTHIPPSLPNHRRPGLRNAPAHLRAQLDRLRTPQNQSGNQREIERMAASGTCRKTTSPRGPRVRAAGTEESYLYSKAHVQLGIPLTSEESWGTSRPPKLTWAGGVCATTGRPQAQHCRRRITARLRARVVPAVAHAPHSARLVTHARSWDANRGLRTPSTLRGINRTASYLT